MVDNVVINHVLTNFADNIHKVCDEEALVRNRVYDAVMELETKNRAVFNVAVKYIESLSGIMVKQKTLLTRSAIHL